MEFLCSNNILSDHQSGLRKGRGAATAAIEVIKNFIRSLDSKRHCVALLIDLSEAFDTLECCTDF